MHEQHKDKYPVLPNFEEHLALMHRRIDALKEELDVTSPPPLPLEQEDRYTD